MHVNMLFGFLGSGKTTLARRLLTENSGAEKTAVIVNEFGDVGIDGAILEGQNVNMVELTSGCLCCTLKGSLLLAVEELREKSGVERVVIEATGVASPEEMIVTFGDPRNSQHYEIGPMVTVVDAAKYPKLKEVLGEFYSDQIRMADVVLLNKIDLAPAADLEEIRAEVLALNPRADIIFTEQSGIDVEGLLSGPDSDVVRRYLVEAGELKEIHDHDHDHDHRHAPAQSFVLDASAPAGAEAARAFFAELPENVWRAKGFMTLDGAANLVQYTMGQLEFTPAEPRAHHHMVFIGPDMDREGISERFAALARGNT